MGRKKKGADLQIKLNGYLKDYELDELNKSNDLVSLRQMCQLEITIESLHDHIPKVNPIKDSKTYKDLIQSLRDAENSFTTLQDQLGIARKKRASETDETPLSYIERLKTQAKTMLSKRLEIIICPICNLTLMKYHIYIKENGEHGSIKWDSKDVDLIPYTIFIECPNCHKPVEINERTKTN
jgi:hypothetical protein